MSTYVYGIAPAGHPGPPEALGGVGDPPRPVRTVEGGGLRAVVSECPEGLRAKRRDLNAHQQVLAEVGALGTVLPLRFGSVADDDEAVRGVLERHAEHYARQLDEVAGRVEFNVKAVHDEESVLRQVLTEDPELRALAQAGRSSGGATYQDKLQLGERVAEAVRAREVADGRAVTEALAAHADRHSPGPESAGWLANVSFLVGREGAAAFAEAADAFGQAHPQLKVQVTGPLPPYSFVEPAPSGV
ncbi:GvpL/GvpF family gas vesicle protein [Streptomyces sp. TRM 70351]|uniref:GvpL/GvpF family gas vesicle protein n=1 Tax=Streptomyces sp. TRM 70351 TaxID=3116552 RepID=UPI002E7B3EEF|nr:GvpL/GvpF family gas vesicle protein [Streptomyces sp. TRM 70351]MEE1928265.1 GvpL/GvpF family gas vesicle protein [Streptomyces sp. TRM 70351]